jgi:hypothetical protein
MMATVVFQTLPTFAGKGFLYVDAEGLILDTPHVNPTPDSGFDALKADIGASGELIVSPIPEPSTT